MAELNGTDTEEFLQNLYSKAKESKEAEKSVAGDNATTSRNQLPNLTSGMSFSKINKDQT